MTQKSLPETIVERAAKITDAALLRQGRVHFLLYQVPLIPGENFSSFVDAVITAFTREVCPVSMSVHFRALRMARMERGLYGMSEDLFAVHPSEVKVYNEFLL